MKKISFLVIAALGIASLNASASYKMKIPIEVKFKDLKETSKTYLTDWYNISDLYDCGSWYPSLLSIKEESNFIQSRDCTIDKAKDYQVTYTNSYTGETSTSSQKQLTETFNELDNRDVSVETVSDWEDVEGTYKCTSWNPDKSSVYVDVEFSQSRECKQDKEKTVRFVSGEDELDVLGWSKTETVEEYQDAVGTKMHTLYIKSCGYTDTSCTSGMTKTVYDGKSYKPSRGIMLIVIDPDTDKVTFTGKYDTHGNYSSVSSLVTKLKSVSSGDLIIINTWDQPSYSSESIISTLKSYYGATLADNLANPSNVSSAPSYRSAYYLVARKDGGKLYEDWKAKKLGGVTLSTVEINP